MQSDRLPVYGIDPLSNTQYLGSDDRYHYFALQKGFVTHRDKSLVHGTDVRDVVIRRDDARIEPSPFDASSGRSAFVASVDGNSVRLLQVPIAPADERDASDR